MKKKRRDKLKGVQIQGIRLNKDDILVIKHPVDEYGKFLYEVDTVREQHDFISKMVDCKVISLPANIELLKVKKDTLDKDVIDTYKKIK